MLTEPIQIGEKYKTRSGHMVTITRSIEARYGNSTYGVEFVLPGAVMTSSVWGDGDFVGRRNQNSQTDYDLVERVCDRFEPKQLTLF